MYGTLISTQTLTGTATTVTFSDIPGTYTDLVLTVSGRTDAAAIFDIWFSFNLDSGANYSQMSLIGNSASASSASLTGQSTISAYYSLPGTTATANTFGSVIVTIPNYTAARAKTVSIESVSENNGTTAYQSLVAGLWNNTAAVTSISVQAYTGNFIAGTTMSLYGLTHF